VAAAKSDIAAIDLQLDAFAVDAGPLSLQRGGAAALMTPPTTVKPGTGRTSRNRRSTPGPALHLPLPGADHTSGADVFSYGADGNEGGGDDVGELDHAAAAVGKCRQ